MYNELSKPYENGLLQYQYRKGSWICLKSSDLKQYYPGDDIRHVHWKLTAETETRCFLKKEHTIVVLKQFYQVDIGLNDQNEEVDKKVLSKALSFASNEVCQKNYYLKI